MLTPRSAGPRNDRSARDASRGQALVEFALVIPMFLAMLFGIVDLGRVVWANNSLANAAREAARFAIVHGGSKVNACPVGPPVPSETVIPAASASCPYPSPSREAVRDHARAVSNAAGTDLVVEVCYGESCVGDTDAIGATNGRGTPVTVTVKSRVPILTGGLIGRGDFSVSGSSTMLVNF